MVTLRLVASVCFTSSGLQLNSRSRSWPKTMVPLPVAPATCVESAVHARLKIEPQFGCSREWLQPVLSHRRSMLNEPTAKYRPLGAHATDEIENSTAAELYSCRPYASHTLYLQSSPPETMRLLTGFQSALSTGASCAFHCVCFADGCSGLITW